MKKEIKLFGKTIYEYNASADTTPMADVPNQEQPQASETGSAYGGYGWQSLIYAYPFDGEKDLGEMGNIKKYVIDHNRLRFRSWQLFLESDVCQALFERAKTWTIGTGLKLKADPSENYLKRNNVSFNAEAFNDEIEELFTLFANSKDCDYEGKKTLHELADSASLNGDVAGDVLIVVRYVDGMPKVKVIDGANVQTPLGFGTFSGVSNDITNPENGNIIRNGVEIDRRGAHVAYWVRKFTLAVSINDYERIEARMKTYPYSCMATLYIGREYRLENVRGIPLISAIMETASKMARYREATLGTAEELAKITYQIKHERFSDGSNPQIQSMAKISGFGGSSDIPTDSYGNALSNRVMATTNKQTFNNPPGASIEPINKGDGEINFKDFYEANFDILCAVAGFPPEVIMSKYNSNYSASRAAIKDFEHTLTVRRGKFALNFYQFVYNFCLDVWVLSGRINLPGYAEALNNKDNLMLTAYRKAEWSGDTVPHIDPYKEVMAIREMMPKDSENFPLATFEDVTDMLGRGRDYKAILKQYQKERDAGKSMGIEMVEPKISNQAPQGNGNPSKKKDD